MSRVNNLAWLKSDNSASAINFTVYYYLSFIYCLLFLIYFRLFNLLFLIIINLSIYLL